MRLTGCTLVDCPSVPGVGVSCVTHSTRGKHSPTAAAFRAVEGATEIVLTQTGFRDPAEAAGHAEGWSQALARFAKLVPAKTARTPRAVRRAG